MPISKAEIEEIREYLLKSERPVYFFDDDPDGLSSFLLFYRFVGRGKGVIVKSSPEVKEEYAAKVNEYSADTVFVLDKPLMSQEFVEKCATKIIWLDHHEPVKLSGVNYYNPRISEAHDGRPTSYWCYRVVQQDLWLAIVGVIGDWYLPDKLADKFSKEYPDLLPEKMKDPAEVLFNTKLGELSRVFAFALKGKTTDVMKCIKILTRIKSPYEILREESSAGRFIYKKYLAVKKEYDELVKDILKHHSNDKMIIYTYPGQKMSFTGELSNEMLYRFPDRINIIGRNRGGTLKCSIRSSNGKLPETIKKCLVGLDGYGGGHENACGLCVKEKDFETFISRFREEIAKAEKN
ncbi:MAG: DHHA1 domain-containing protein [Candidatus Woesearchaeota archaeon]|nr:DHHA1 domain-containing protein [Candidatus Woesearchaeota archaeon]